MGHLRHELPLAWLLLAALALRLAYIALTDDYQALFDAGDFDRHASSIAAGDGYADSTLAGGGPSAFRPPAFAYLLGGLYAIVGDSIVAGRVLGALLGTVGVLLTYAVARKLWTRRVALIAAGITAVFPPLIVLNTALLSESMFIVLMLLLVLWALRLDRSKRPGVSILLLGMICGAAALTRSNGWLLLVPLALAIWRLEADNLRRVARLGFAVLGTALVIAPWAVRNAIEFDRFIPTTTQAGFGVAGTYNDAARTGPEYQGTWLGKRMVREFQPLFDDPSLGEDELGDELMSRARDYAVEHPGYVLKACVLNTLRTFWFLHDGYEQFLNVTGAALRQDAIAVLRWITVAFVLLAAAGIVVLVGSRSLRWGPLFVWLIPLLMLASAIPISGDPRYRAPADPFLAMLAAIALAALWQRFAGRRGGEAHDAC